MERDTLTLEVPKFHPVTGVRLDGNYDFAFEANEAVMKILELEQRLESSESKVYQLKAEKDDLRKDTELKQQCIKKLQSANEKLEKKLREKAKFREQKKKAAQLKRVCKYLYAGKESKFLERDVEELVNP